MAVLAAGLVLAPTARSANRSPAARTLLFLGDSLTAGYGLDDPEAQSYPALIADRIRAAGLPWKVVNAGVSGDTSADGLARLNWLLRRHIDLLVLALGANDGLRGIDPSVTRRNLEAIIDEVRRREPGATIVLAGMRMPPSLGTAYAAAFDRTFPQVAGAEHVRLIPFLLAGVAGRPELNQADAIHPNAAGAQRVARTVWAGIRPLVEATPSSPALPP